MQRGVCRITASHRNLTPPGTSWQCRVQLTWIHLVPSCNKVYLFYPLCINEVIPAQHQHQAAGDSCLAPPSAHPRPVQLCRKALQELSSRSSPDPNCMLWKSLDTSRVFSGLQQGLKPTSLFFPLARALPLRPQHERALCCSDPPSASKKSSSFTTSHLAQKRQELLTTETHQWAM